MKIFAIAAISALAFTSLSEAARTPNQKLALDDCSIDKDAPEKFIQCFYNKHGAAPVNDKLTEYKRVASRISTALDKAGDDKAKQKRFVRAILIKNANLFGQSKTDMKQLIDENSDYIEEYANMVKYNVNVEEAKEFLNSLNSSTVTELEQQALDIIQQKIGDLKNQLGFENVDTDAAIHEAKKALKNVPEVKEFFENNSNEKVENLLKNAIEQFNVQDKVNDLKNQAGLN